MNCWTQYSILIFRKNTRKNSLEVVSVFTATRGNDLKTTQYVYNYVQRYSFNQL
jgi:hypothetical protein